MTGAAAVRAGVAVAVLAGATGCLSLGGGVVVAGAVTDTPVRRVSGQLQIGSHVEIVEDRLVGQLFYTRGLGPLGGRTNQGTWGARITTGSRGLRPGLYALAAYGESDGRTQPDASSLVGGLGVAYSRIRSTRRWRLWRTVSLGVVVRREHQETIDEGRQGYFLGLELGVIAGGDLLGPMFAAE